MKRREAIRRSFAGSTNSSSVLLLFLLGVLPTDGSGNATAIAAAHDRIEQESATFGDVIVQDFVDTYANLTIKSLMMIKFLEDKVRGQLDFDYFFKVKADPRILVHCSTYVVCTTTRSLRVR